MTRGRKPTATPDIIEPDLDQGRIDNAVAVMRETAISEEVEIRTEVYRLGQLVGARQMNQLTMKMLAAADISLFEEISNSKAYKHIQIKRDDGTFAAANNIDEFCRLTFNRSYTVLVEGRQALQALGTECYELANSMGLPRTQMRLLLSLPEDEREAVKEAMQSGSKAEVVTLIQSLANKLDETRDQVESLKAELQDTQVRSSEKSEEIERLKEERVRIKRAVPDDVLYELRAETTRRVDECLGLMQGNLRGAFSALVEHHATYGGDSHQVMTGFVAQIQQLLLELRDEFNLADPVGDGTPEWMRATAGDADLAEA